MLSLLHVGNVAGSGASTVSGQSAEQLFSVLARSRRLFVSNFCVFCFCFFSNSSHLDGLNCR